MYKNNFLAIFVIMAILLTSCARPKNSKTYSMNWRQAMRYAMQQYRPEAQKMWQPYFARARIPFPPKALTFLIFKESKQFQVYAKNQGVWHYIRTFPVLAASGGPGPKLHVGDHQVPEGEYRIIGMNPKSRFDLSMHLNYPNVFDRQQASLAHRIHLGGNIYIHGRNRSIGCIAIGDAAIQQIFPLVAQIGMHHVNVIIAPDDLRYKPPIYGYHHPKWLKGLYHRIKQALASYPMPIMRS